MSGCKYVSEWLQSIAISLTFLAYLLVVSTHKCYHVSELIRVVASFSIYYIGEKKSIVRKKVVQDR